MNLWAVYVAAKSRGSVVSRKWVSAADEEEASRIETEDSRSVDGVVLLLKRHHSGSVSMTDQWSVNDILAIAAQLSR